MNSFKFNMYNFVSPKEEDIPEIAKYIHDNNIFTLPRNLQNSLLLLNYYLTNPDPTFNAIQVAFDTSVYERANLDDIVKYVLDKNLILYDGVFSDIILNNPEFWTKILQSDNYSIFCIDSLFSRDINVYNQIDKDLIARALTKTYTISGYDFVQKDIELLKTIIDKHYNVSLESFDEGTLNAVGYDKLIDYYSNDDVRGDIPAKILENRDLLTKLCDRCSGEKLNSIVRFQNIPLENKFFIYQKYVVFFDSELIEPFADYVIKNNITELSDNAFLYISRLLIDKNYSLFFNTINNRYVNIFALDDSKRRQLVNLYFNGNYDGKLTDDFEYLIFGSDESLKHIDRLGDYIIKNNLKLIYTFPCRNSLELANYLCDKNYNQLLNMNFDQSVIENISPDKLSEYIVNNNIIVLPQYSSVLQALPFLIDKKYDKLFDIDLYCNATIDEDYTLDDSHKEKLIDLFFASHYTDYVGYDFENLIFSSPKCLEHIDAIGSYIINNNVRKFVSSSPCINSVELFNYLYDEDYENLFQLNFSAQLFNKIPIQKIQDYYQRHPDIQIERLNINLRLIIQNINLSNVDYKVVKGIVLYDSRLDADKEMVKYDDISTKICTLLKVKEPYDVFDQFVNEMIDVILVMKMSEEEIITLFTNYKNNPEKYTDSIIELFKKFLSKRKETIATDYLNHRMEYILENFTSQDLTELIKNVRMEKRKQLYLNKLKELFHAINNHLHNTTDGFDTIINTSNASRIISLINSYGLNGICTSEYELVAKIINGDVVIERPMSSIKVEKQKVLTRLNNNYHKQLINIIAANANYKSQIISYIKGEVSYDELRRFIDAKDLKVLLEIRNLFTKINPTMDENFNFALDFNVTSDDINISREYDMKMQAINKLRKFLNRLMNEAYPLDKIEVTEEELKKFGKIEDIKACFDPIKIGNLESLIEIFKIRDSFEDKKCVEIFNKLLIDSGAVYGMPYISYQLSNDIILLAKKMDYIVDFVPEKDITFDNLAMLIKKAKALSFYAPHRMAILGEETIYQLVTNETFIWQLSALDKEKRVEDGAKYIALAGRNIKSTTPYNRVETDEYIAERYHSDDPEILLAGIKTDACFRLYGNDNDFLLYTMFNKNGLVVKLTDKDGKFVGRMSGFRNGNTVYFNQLRTIYDTGGYPTKKTDENIQKIRECAIKYANSLIESTKDSNEPIEHILITQSYGFAEYEDLPKVTKPSDTPMDTTGSDFKEFKLDPELNLLEPGAGFTTDYHTSYPVLLMATSSLEKMRDEGVKSYSPEAIYDKPRKKPIVYNGQTNDYDILKDINAINAKSIYWGDTDKREDKKRKFRCISSADDIKYAIIGEDFYIIIDNSGKLSSLCLPYDGRANAEFLEYLAIAQESYKNDNGIKR